MIESSRRMGGAVVCLLVVAGALAACGGSGQADGNSGAGRGGAGEGGEEWVEFRETEPGSGEGMKIGMIALDDSVPFSKLVSDSVKEQADIAGAELVFCDSKLDAAEALDCARNFATQGVEGYLNFQPVADAAQSICNTGPQDVPVIAIDIAQGDCQTAFMGANNSRAGQVAGTGLGEYMKEKFDCKYDAYVSLEDKGVGEVNDDRMNGIREGFEEVCGQIVNERVLDAGRQDVALTKFTDTLTALPDAERIVVVGINDDAVLGALAAARTAGRADQVYMSGMGADPSSHCEIATNPNWAGDSAFFPERYGEIGVPYLIDAIKGEEIPPTLLVNHQFINRDNVGEFYDVESC
jgi:ribose transport system substrate-binding protein